jgi:CheY-like chemotaxis protein
MHNLLVKSIPKMIEIKTNLHEDIFLMEADSTQIGQVIMNLVINARDAIGESGTITIMTNNLILLQDADIAGQNVPAGNYVELIISDTGCGIEEDIMQRIFEPFFTTKEVGKGTGLGLAVVYGVVQNHNGFLCCNSKQGDGATFNIIFPASTDVRTKNDAEPQHKEISMGTETILLVDDEKGILETNRDTLGLYGYKVLTAENGEQALDIYQSHRDKIHLVVLDLIMPGRGGKKCLSDLITINPRVKVLMTSGYSSSDQIDELTKTGAAGFINKPYHSDDFLSAIRKIIDEET